MAQVDETKRGAALTAMMAEGRLRRMVGLPMSIIGRSTVRTPNVNTTDLKLRLGEGERTAVISMASDEFRVMNVHSGGLSDRRAWVNGALHERGMELLSEDEWNSLDLLVSPDKVREVANAAAQEYDAQPAATRLFCSRAEYVQETLRGAGFPQATVETAEGK